MNDLWTNRLSEYIDGELDNSERAALEAHLATCGHCYATLADLRQVVARAKTLEDREPAKDLWTGIRAGLTEERGARLTPGRLPGVSRRFSFSVPQLLAASIALAFISGGGMWMALKPGKGVTTVVGTRPPDPRGERFTPVTWTSQTDQAVAELEDALTRNESQLDTATVRVVRQSLAVIDRAITDARAALLRDPGNTYLNLHLANTMRRKVELLRRINALAVES
ncbi:MAG TPA: zf-HC2 domain-containing protein [Gemmatimonadales bacterium]|nr:zf-HC2 domain-containing protein [Gemmatimonadales bacterium]